MAELEAGFADPLLVVDRVSKVFQDGEERLNALHPVSFVIQTGEFVCILGPSGSGKSTLLRIIGGLVGPSTGTVRFAGQPVRQPPPAMGFVFQRTNLMPWRTVLDNVLLPLEVQSGRPDDVARQQAFEMLELVGLDGFAHTYPRQLSGGMAQRVVLARALIQQPLLLLMDEPFGALDALTRERLNLELLRLCRRNGQTVLMVTHSIQEAVFLADRVLVLTERPGRIKTEIHVDLPRPRLSTHLGSEPFGRLTTLVREAIDD